MEDTNKIRAEYDYAGSECAIYKRWIFKGSNEKITGAIHVHKDMVPPKEVTIQLTGGPENVSER